MESLSVKDLRLGNWITDNNNFPMQVVSLGTDYMYAYFEGNEGDVWEFDFENNKPKPISLTEEILLKCGFRRIGTEYQLPDSTLDWYFSTRCGFIPKIYHTHTLKSCRVVGVYYLHQLQNLYHALTGQELNVEL